MGGIIDEIGIWDRDLTPIEITSLYNGGTGLTYVLGIDTTLNSPTNNSIGYTGNNITFNATTSSPNNLKNATLYLNGFINKTKTISGITNETIFSKRLTPGNYNWSFEACDDADDCTVSDTWFFTLKPIQFNTKSYNESSTETAYETFITNVTGDGLKTLTATLYYNGTTYTTTKTGNDNESIFTKSFDIPLNPGNKTFYWNVSYGGVGYQSANYSQNISNTIFTLCNTTYTNPFINLTFQNETDLNTILDATIPLFSVNYYLGSGTVSKNLTFTNVTGNPSYAFCGNPTDRNISTSFTLQYANAGGTFPQRTFEDVTTFGNVTTNQVLYLLATADGIYVTFQVINQVEQTLSGVHVTATRVISGSTVTVGEGDTGADGGVTFWLNPNFEHTFTFDAAGYELYTTSLTPTQTSYTVIMGGGTAPEINDYSRGITMNINPPATQTLYNDTTYNFNMTITTSYWDLEGFGFYLKLINGTILDSESSSSSSGGTLTNNLNTGNYTNIVMEYYWIINGSTQTRNAYWNVINTDNTQWSINNFFTDFNTYLTTGLFGLDDFGKYLIVYIILFFTVGIMSYKYGLVSPLAITAMIFGVIYTFDVVLNLLPPTAGIPNFYTFAAGIVLGMIIIREVLR